MTDNGMIEVRCPQCGFLLFKGIPGSGVVEIKCKNCKHIVRWPSIKPEIVEDKPKRRLISE